MSKIILASGSPRRKTLLANLGLTFEVFKPKINEDRVSGERPARYCVRLARTKATAVAERFSNDIVIAADTIVVIDDEILGTPSDREDAKRMLNKLSGREHEVMTGLSVIHGDNVYVHCERTGVKFRDLSEDEINAYSETGEGDDKAGAYAVQGKGALLIEGITGDYYNVVGLPIC